VQLLEKQNRGRCLYLAISESPDLAPRHFSLHKHGVEQLAHTNYLAHIDDAVLEALHQGFTVQAHIQIASQQEIIPESERPLPSETNTAPRRISSPSAKRLRAKVARATWMKALLTRVYAIHGLSASMQLEHALPHGLPAALQAMDGNLTFLLSAGRRAA